VNEIFLGFCSLEQPHKISNINLLITTVDSILDGLYEERGYTPHNAINLNSLVQLLHPLN